VATLGTAVSPGLCGDYTLTDANGTVLASGGGTFGAQQIRSFCLTNGVANITPPSPTDGAVIDNTTGLVMEIRPNVANERITVTYSGIEIQQTLQISIIDLTGKVIHSQVTSAETSFIDIDVSDLQVGYYFVQMVSNKDILTKKFIKN